LQSCYRLRLTGHLGLPHADEIEALPFSFSAHEREIGATPPNRRPAQLAKFRNREAASKSSIFFHRDIFRAVAE